MKHTFWRIYRDTGTDGGGGGNPPAGDPPGGDPPSGDPTPADPPAGDPPGEDPPGGDPNGGDGGESDDDTPDIAFWSGVSEELGLEGAVVSEWLKDVEDRLSPQAVAKYSKNLAEAVRNDFLENMKAEDPRAYAYMLHRKRGLSDEEFFNSPASVLPAKDKLENSVDLQKKFFTTAMLKKGIPEDDVDALVERAMKDGKLKEKTLSLLEAEQASINSSIQDYERSLKEQQAAEAAAYNQTVNTYAQMVKTDLPVYVPEADQAPFLDFVAKSIVLDPGDGEFYISLPVGSKKEDSSKLLQAMYLLYKGDLSKIKPRERKAQVPKLGIPPKQGVKVPEGGGLPAKPGGTEVTLSSFFEGRK